MAQAPTGGFCRDVGYRWEKEDINWYLFFIAADPFITAIGRLCSCIQAASVGGLISGLISAFESYK